MPTHDTPRPYDLTVIRRVDGANPDAAAAFAAKTKAALEAKAATVVAVDVPPQKRLAYPIKGQNEGVYVTFQVVAKSEDILEMKRQIDLDEEGTLRSLLISVPSAEIFTCLQPSESEAS